MSILDAYILRRIARPLALVFAVFVAVFILVDLFDHAHSFIDNNVPVGTALLYYLYYTPLIIVLTSPVAMLLATLLSVGGLARSNEIMAMKGSGVSLHRVLLPILVLSLVVSAVDVLIGETLLPPATQRRLSIEESEIKRRGSDIVKNEPVFVLPDGTMFLARRLNTRTQTLDQVTVEEYRHEGVPARRIDAERATWEDDEWVFYDGTARVFTGERELVARFDRLAPGYYEPTPGEMGTRRLEPDEMPYRELRAHIARLRASGKDPRELSVQLHLKTSFPFVTVIMTLLGGALAAGTRRSGFALSFAAALAVSFLYYGVLQVGQVLGRQGILVPWLAAWLANILFAGVGLALLSRAPK